MLTVTTETIEGKRIISVLGLVEGNTVRARNIGRDVLAGLKNLIGGELAGYSKMLTEARVEARERMIEEAEALGGNAIVNIRYSTAQTLAGAAEILAYGTAVVIE